jgi:hypothetical protein
MNLNQLANEIESRLYGSRSNTFKWASGSKPNETSVTRVEKLVPGSRQLFDLPVWEMLAASPIRHSSILAALEPYRRIDKGRAWCFPNDDELRSRGIDISTYARNDIEGLSSRGDQYGFLALVALVREAECLGEPQLHIYRSVSLVRSLPSLLATSPWSGFRSDIISVVRQLLDKGPMTSTHVEVYWENIIDSADKSSSIHPINWRGQRAGQPYVARVVDFSLPPPSPWAAWLLTTRQSDWVGGFNSEVQRLTRP